MTLEEHAQNIRRNILEAGHKAGMIHYGGARLSQGEMGMVHGTELASGTRLLGSLFHNGEVTSATGAWS